MYKMPGDYIWLPYDTVYDRTVGTKELIQPKVASRHKKKCQVIKVFVDVKDVCYLCTVCERTENGFRTFAIKQSELKQWNT